MKSCGRNELKAPHLAPPFPHLFPSGSLHFSIVTGSLPHGSGQLELHLRHEDLTALSGQCGTSQVLVPASKMPLERKCSRSLAPNREGSLSLLLRYEKQQWPEHRKSEPPLQRATIPQGQWLSP